MLIGHQRISQLYTLHTLPSLWVLHVLKLDLNDAGLVLTAGINE